MYVFSPDDGVLTSTDLPSSNLIFRPVSSQIFSPCVACVSRSGTALDSIDGAE